MTDKATDGTVAVEAAGGLVVDDGRIMAVHRPHRADWSLPKGKLDPGETHEQAALREVHEETGLRCRLLGDDPVDVRYTDHRGRTKRVRWYAMAVVEGTAGPDHEVDEVRWIGPDELDLLTYADDRTLAAAALAQRGR